MESEQKKTRREKRRKRKKKRIGSYQVRHSIMVSPFPQPFCPHPDKPVVAHEQLSGGHVQFSLQCYILLGLLLGWVTRFQTQEILR